MGKITKFVYKKIGSETHVFQVEGKDLHDVMMEEKKLSFGNVETCGICNGNNLELSAHDTDEAGYDYTYIRCRNCKATLNFGKQKKNPDIYYLKTIEVQNGNYKNQVYDWKPFVPNAPKK